MEVWEWTRYMSTQLLATCTNFAQTSHIPVDASFGGSLSCIARYYVVPEILQESG
jgi:hypothetical protein